MSWRRLLASRSIARHATSFQELVGLDAAVERDLKDASVLEISNDARFSIAYNAALPLTKMVIACEGYRVTGQGAHHTTFEGLTIAMGGSMGSLAAYFNECRRKRNKATYDLAGAISEAEAMELLTKGRDFRRKVHLWISKNHPRLAIP